MTEEPHGCMHYRACHTRQALVTAAVVIANLLKESYVVPQSSCTGSHILKYYGIFFWGGGGQFWHGVLGSARIGLFFTISQEGKQQGQLNQTGQIKWGI